MIKRKADTINSMTFEYKFKLPFDYTDNCIDQKVEEFKAELLLILNMQPQPESVEKNEILNNLKKIMKSK
jgi:hypothetical protein